MKFLITAALSIAAVSAQTQTAAPVLPSDIDWRVEGIFPDVGLNVEKRWVLDDRAPEPTAAPALEARAACAANNCARAVTGTRSGKMPNVASRMSDCASFLQTTVLTNYGGFSVGTVTASAVPSYASPCSTPVNAQSAYASACSCWGVPPSTTTSAAPQACTVDAQFKNCAGGYAGKCYCWSDKKGNAYCDASFLGGYILPNRAFCSSDADCPATNPVCSVDGLCDVAVDGSQCA
jgi:hypothetical protein